MDKQYQLALTEKQKAQSIAALKDCNYLTGRYGLSLSDSQIANLVEQRFETLRDTGRIEFGEGILTKLAEAFCDSVYITQQNYEEALSELQAMFYYFKNESGDALSDDELIGFMRRDFDGVCQGSLEYLAETSLEALCRNTRFGSDMDEPELEEQDEFYEE